MLVKLRNELNIFLIILIRKKFNIKLIVCKGDSVSRGNCALLKSCYISMAVLYSQKANVLIVSNTFCSEYLFNSG